jgi:translation initiation factor IF-2
MKDTSLNTQTGNLRAPIVVILGHVDHGKTTLLDYLRKTRVAQKEAGGITQSTGASVVTTKEGKKITFIDTPGHAAFSSMRSRGAKIADIAVLVIAGDDGIKPQTKEALEFILAAHIPFIVAVTKIDLPNASLDTVRIQVEKMGVALEGRGGEVPVLGVSGKTGKGVDELLEMITLLAELNSLKGIKNGSLDAMVIETAKDNRGLLVMVVVKDGTLKVGDEIIAETENAKVRGLFDTNKTSVREIYPGEPALILGFEKLPPVGSNVWKLSEKGGQIAKITEKNLTEIYVGEDKLTLLLKASSSGSLEAIIDSLPQGVTVVSSGVGEVTDSDLFLAKSMNALIFAFEVKIPAAVVKLAETEGIKIYSFDIIYKLFEALEDIFKKGRIEVLGEAEVIASFPYEDKKVAGCRIVKGIISKGINVRLMRADKLVGEVRIISMKKQKEDITSAKQGEECGIIFVPQLDFKIGDVILSVRKN